MVMGRGASLRRWVPGTEREVQARRNTWRRPARGLKQGRISLNSWYLPGALSNGCVLICADLLINVTIPCVCFGMKRGRLRSQALDMGAVYQIACFLFVYLPIPSKLRQVQLEDGTIIAEVCSIRCDHCK
jgi:hypothetical protein